MADSSVADVLRVGAAHSVAFLALTRVAHRYGLSAAIVAPGQAIPGSYWGEDEAGLKGSRLFVRSDTPLHSALHEACHFICMSDERRRALDTDAGGDDLEECAVCFLSIVLSDEIPAFGRDVMLGDMDAWGYSFRLGSARAWFEHDADDARAWLRERALIDEQDRPLRPRPVADRWADC